MNEILLSAVENFCTAGWTSIIDSKLKTAQTKEATTLAKEYITQLNDINEAISAKTADHGVLFVEMRKFKKIVQDLLVPEKCGASGPMEITSFDEPFKVENTHVYQRCILETTATPAQKGSNAAAVLEAKIIGAD